MKRFKWFRRFLCWAWEGQHEWVMTGYLPGKNFKVFHACKRCGAKKNDEAS